MPRIDKDRALQMMQAGDSDTVVASRFGTSRQAVNLLRKSLVLKGRLHVPLAGATISPATDPPSSRHAPSLTTQTQGTEPGQTQPASRFPTYEQIGDWVIQLVKEAAASGRLRQENIVLRQRADGLLAEVLTLQDRIRHAEERLTATTSRSLQYETTVQQSQLPPIAGV